MQILPSTTESESPVTEKEAKTCSVCHSQVALTTNEGSVSFNACRARMTA